MIIVSPARGRNSRTRPGKTARSDRGRAVGIQIGTAGKGEEAEWRGGRGKIEKEEEKGKVTRRVLLVTKLRYRRGIFKPEDLPLGESIKGKSFSFTSARPRPRLSSRYDCTGRAAG